MKNGRLLPPTASELFQYENKLGDQIIEFGFRKILAPANNRSADKSRYFAQPPPIVVNEFTSSQTATPLLHDTSSVIKLPADASSIRCNVDKSTTQNQRHYFVESSNFGNNINYKHTKVI